VPLDLDLVRSNARFTLGQLLDRLATAGRVEVEAAITLAIATQHRGSWRPGPAPRGPKAASTRTTSPSCAR
jgi:hypothetical protein